MFEAKGEIYHDLVQCGTGMEQVLEGMTSLFTLMTRNDKSIIAEDLENFEGQVQPWCDNPNGFDSLMEQLKRKESG